MFDLSPKIVGIAAVAVLCFNGRGQRHHAGHDD